MFQLVKKAAKPLGDQLVDELRNLIESGRLPPGSRLPSVRKLATRAAVSPYTVTSAFERLQATGLIEARPGSGHFVALRTANPMAAAIELGPALSQDAALGFARSSFEGKKIVLPAGAGYLPTSWFADAIPPSLMAQIRGSGALASPPPVQGDPQLRELLAERLHARGVPAGSSNIITTMGASQGFDVLARSFIAPGDTVLVDDPGYFVLLARLRTAGARIIPVPKQPDGSALGVLEEMAKTYRPRMFFTQTLLHNPTGITSSAANCHGILKLAEKYDFLIAEDHVYSDLGAPHLVSLAQIDELRRVFYLGSFTKVLCPGVRIGFLAAPDRCIGALLDAKVLAVLSGSSLDEAVLRTVLSSGKYRRYLDRLRDRLARSRASGLAALSAAGLQFDFVPGDGMFLWGRIPPGVDTQRLTTEARDAGILLAPGAIFSVNGQCDAFLRFNVAYASDPRLVAFPEERLRVPFEQIHAA